MNDEIMFTIGDDGVAREYKDDYDITIHCESKEEQERAWELLTRRWIPCSERLPEAYQYVLRTVKRLVWDEGIGYSTCLDVDIGTYNTNDGSVVAWMPLPKPYEAERKEE